MTKRGISAGILACVLLANIICLLFPVQAGAAKQMEAVLSGVSSYGAPLALTVVLIVSVSTLDRIALGATLKLSFICTAVYVLSAWINGTSLKNFAMAAYFVVASFAIFLSLPSAIETPRRIVAYSLVAIVIWAILPLGLILNSSGRDQYINELETSFHGFADSRIAYGYWSALLYLMLFRKIWSGSDRVWLYWTLLALNLLGIYLSQSRAATVGIAFATAYFIFSSQAGLKKKTMATTVVILLTLATLKSWQIFGRQEPFEVFNSTRASIYGQYLELLRWDKVLLGYGEQVSIHVVVHGPVQTQAHNLLLQWLINFGVLGLLALLAYLLTIWCGLQSIWARMAFLIFMIYSLTQPIQGTANFFSPATLTWFFIMMSLEICERRSSRHEKYVSRSDGGCSIWFPRISPRWS